MAYGTLKCDNIVFDNGGTDKLVTVSGLFFSTSGALTVTGTISGGNVTAPTATFTTLTGTTTAGTTATFTSGSFTSLTGVTTTVTSGIFGLGSAAAPSIAVSGYPNTGIYSPGADQLAISTGGTVKAIVDSSGRLLVGTSSAPTGSSSQFSKLAVQGNSSNAFGGYFSLGYGGAGTGLSADADIGTINFTDTGAGQFAQIRCDADAATSAGDFPGRLVFSTTADGAASPTERMRITSGGSVQSTNWTFSPSAINSRAVYFSVDAGWGGAGQGGLVAVNTSNGVVLGVSATSWASYSDVRMKTDLVPIENGLTKVSTLRAVTGRYHTDDASTSRSFLIAQDVEKVFPEAVESGNPDKLGLRYTEVIPLLVAALKESKERIEQLETEMAAVKAQLS